LLELTVRRTLHLTMTAEAAFDWIADPAHYHLFKGAGPIPGIASVSNDGTPRHVGQVDRIANSDGSEHQETVVAIDRPVRYQVRIEDFPIPPTLIVDHMVETWEFAPHGDGVAITRTFVMSVRNNPVAWLLSPVLSYFMGMAVDRHHAALLAAPR
jgi:hypothetical protein